VKALYVRMMDMYVFSNLSRVVAMAMTLRAFFARSSDGSTVLFRYFMLGATLQHRVGYMLGFAEHF